MKHKIRQFGRRLLSLGLCALLLAGLLPLGAWAANEVTLNVENGSISITASGYSIGGGAENAHTGSYKITGSTDTNGITVESGSPQITLSGLTVDFSAREITRKDEFFCAFAISSGASPTLILQGNNTLKSGEGRAGLQVPEGAKVAIRGSGRLHAEGGLAGAGIGGGVTDIGRGQNAGKITIGGDVEISAVGGNKGAGIGGGGGIARPQLVITDPHHEILEDEKVFIPSGTYTVSHDTGLAAKSLTIAGGTAGDGDITTSREDVPPVPSDYFEEKPATFTSDYGVLYVKRDGTWEYRLSHESDTLQALQEGETRTETFNVTVIDLYGKDHTQPISIKITGQGGDLVEITPTPRPSSAPALKNQTPMNPNSSEALRGGNGAEVIVTGGLIRAGSIGGGNPDASSPGSLTVLGGIVFQGTEGQVGKNTQLKKNFTISSGERLVVPNNAALTIPRGKTLTIEDGGTVENNGILYLYGEILHDVPGQYGALTGAGRIITAVSPPVLETGDHRAYFNGYKDETIRPERSLTREETAQVFYNLMDEASRAQYESTDCPFQDVPEGKWSYQAICTLANAGILKGSGENLFRPTAAVTRAEFAAIAARFDPGTYTGEDFFSDIAGHWAETDINYAANKGWVKGYKDGAFHPNGKITRAEAAALINRVLSRAPETVEDLLPGRRVFSDNTDEKKWYYLDIEEAANSHDYRRKDHFEAWEAWTALR